MVVGPHLHVMHVRIKVCRVISQIITQDCGLEPRSAVCQFCTFYLLHQPQPLLCKLLSINQYRALLSQSIIYDI